MSKISIKFIFPMFSPMVIVHNKFHMLTIFKKSKKSLSYNLLLYIKHTFSKINEVWLLIYITASI